MTRSSGLRIGGSLAVAVACATALAWLASGAAPAEQQPEAPTVNGKAISGSYSYEGRFFVRGGYRFSPELVKNVVDISCSSDGVADLTGGPDGSPECVWPGAGVDSATVTISGRVRWFSLTKKFTLTPYWSLDNQTYVFGPDITVSARAATSPSSTRLKKPEAAQSYVAAIAPVNPSVSAFSGQVEAWDSSTSKAQALSEGQPTAAVLQEVGPKLAGIGHAYRPAAAALKAQAKTVEVIVGDLARLARLNAGVDVSSWRHKFQADIAKLVAASTVVRSKLGLPAPSSSEPGQK
jgi:hypothetical protein